MHIFAPNGEYCLFLHDSVIHLVAFQVPRKNLIQWNLDLAKSLGTGQIRSLNGGFVVSRFFFIYFSIAGAKNTVRYIEVLVK